jgi:hypothetical protein
LYLITTLLDENGIEAEVQGGTTLEFSGSVSLGHFSRSGCAYGSDRPAIDHQWLLQGRIERITLVTCFRTDFLIKPDG